MAEVRRIKVKDSLSKWFATPHLQNTQSKMD
jgi:hypothetical protein